METRRLEGKLENKKLDTEILFPTIKRETYSTSAAASQEAEHEIIEIKKELKDHPHPMGFTAAPLAGGGMDTESSEKQSTGKDPIRKKNQCQGGRVGHPRKKYKYADRLQFLLPTLYARGHLRKKALPPAEKGAVFNGRPPPMSRTDPPSPAAPLPSTSLSLQTPPPSRKRSRLEGVEGTLVGMLRCLVDVLTKQNAESKVEDCPDLVFLKSMLPGMKLVPPERRAALKAEIFQLIVSYIPHQPLVPSLPIPPPNHSYPPFPMPTPPTLFGWYNSPPPYQGNPPPTGSAPIHYPGL
ncbi:uncharacterized protein LOC108719555 isoform X2 [Xenopus laevis]|uniref:BESS domain-containing protein n=2 Tax=Xenopus laevis TaxID=8355 RepID=A0A974HET6_XENLA|nr:uncharacterized protein LOC108719555 isoform X2 [Xenopus laevis]OCT75258.1 hypothetical protein XELAEV_18030436mg [Xenopus laevis]